IVRLTINLRIISHKSNAIDSRLTATLLRIRDNTKDTTIERRTKYFDRDRPISAMEHRQADIPITIDKKVCFRLFAKFYR
ncbi:unnamed protein product, partial [Rotaria sordida]